MGLKMKLAIASWSLHRQIPTRIPLIQFSGICQKEFGVEAIELNSPFFESTKPAYLSRLRESISKRGMRVVNIAVDLGNIASPDNTQRNRDIEALKEWFTIGKLVDSLSIRVNAGWGEPVDEAMMKRIVESYKELTKEAERMGMNLLIENHGGPSADPDNIVRIVKAVGSDNFGTCPDFGNFASHIRYEGLAKISSYALLAHAKTYKFDERGEETSIDIKKCLDILKEAGFQGYLSIEYEGEDDEYEGVKKTIALLKKSGCFCGTAKNSMK